MSSTNNRFVLPSRYEAGESVWVEFFRLALETDAVNLGPGFPDFFGPETLTRALAKVAASDNVFMHQYTRGFGHPRLVSVLSRLYSTVLGREINAQNEILVTSGAYEALYSTILGHISPGDEVIIIEPFFDPYVPMVQAAGGIPVYIPLRPSKSGEQMMSGDWKLDDKELKSAFSERTKAIILNTPHNPLGKVFTLEELTAIADLCKKWNVLCISDEVYEWLVFKPYKHIRIASLPGMWERTVTIGSAGKTFSVTGWKIGWAYASVELMKNLYVVHQNCVYTCVTPIQEALAQSFEHELERLGKEDCYFESFARDSKPKRDFMVKMLTDIGMKPTVPEGGYFMLADWSQLEDKVNLAEETDIYQDYRFAKWMTKNVGIQGIPPAAFYNDKNKSLAKHYIRYSFVKKDETLLKAAAILKKWKEGNKM